jgi:hypothetical protein
MGKTTELRRELRRTFVPFAEQRGFTFDQRYAPQFWEFRRIRDGNLQVFDVQWARHGSPRFVVNFGVCSATEIEVHGQKLLPQSVSPAHCARGGRLQPGKGSSLRHWFRQDKIWWERLLGRQAMYAPEQVCGSLMVLFEELEAFWQSDTLGPHMHFAPGRVGQTV